MITRQFGKSFELDAAASVNRTMVSQIGPTRSILVGTRTQDLQISEILYEEWHQVLETQP
jgi:hypothetical protein